MHKQPIKWTGGYIINPITIDLSKPVVIFSWAFKNGKL